LMLPWDVSNGVRISTWSTITHSWISLILNFRLPDGAGRATRMPRKQFFARWNVSIICE
jgi:hypothetical protein